MRTHAVANFFLAALAFSVLTPPAATRSAAAAVVGPGDTLPTVSGDIFRWNRGDAGSTYNAWDVFEAAVPPANPSGGFTDATPDLAGQFGPLASVTVGPGGIPLGSGNAYSPFAALSFHAIAPSGTSGNHTRIIAQFQTGGSELDYGNLFLSADTLSPGTIAPSFAIQTGRTSLGGFGGDQVNYLALWDLDASQAQYRIDFRAASSSLALQQLHIDTFTSVTPFTTPTVSAVPEPGSFAAATFVAAAAFWKRRRTLRRRAVCSHR